MNRPYGCWENLDSLGGLYLFQNRRKLCRIYRLAVQTDMPIRQMIRLQPAAGFDARVDLHMTDGDGWWQIRRQGLHFQRLHGRLPLRGIASVEVIADGGKLDALCAGCVRRQLPSQAQDAFAIRTCFIGGKQGLHIDTFDAAASWLRVWRNGRWIALRRSMLCVRVAKLAHLRVELSTVNQRLPR